MKGDSLFALIAGAAAGLTLGLLFAPEKGEDTRRKVKSAAQHGWDEFSEAASEGWDNAKETFDDLKESAEDATSRLRARARLARRDLKDLKSTLQEQTANFTEEARVRIIEKLDQLEKALRNDVAEAGTPEEQVQEEA
ncbi:MAG: YtxH domain-containing protein [Bacteroidales bacterium]|nr:YtxH domain-containing protein [Bacteroidales bacterium]